MWNDLKALFHREFVIPTGLQVTPRNAGEVWRTKAASQSLKTCTTRVPWRGQMVEVMWNFYLDGGEQVMRTKKATLLEPEGTRAAQKYFIRKGKELVPAKSRVVRRKEPSEAPVMQEVDLPFESFTRDLGAA